MKNNMETDVRLKKGSENKNVTHETGRAKKNRACSCVLVWKCFEGKGGGERKREDSPFEKNDTKQERKS